MSQDIGTTSRKPLTPTQRLKLFEEHKGICCICGCKIHAGQPWWDEHERALALGGSNELTNRGPAHKRCAEKKTREQDLPRIAKAKRQKIAAHGMKRSANPLPCGKRSPWKKKMSGEVVSRFSPLQRG